MVRAPCCEKMGLKKGAWTREEDQLLIDYINQHGHGNWRALPKQAGLLRCGKSCRLRWANYLRPDIKRGNLSKEEEDTIIKLHEALGNRWSAIAARLPGRTDNEIKNVWHTHLKKKQLKKIQETKEEDKKEVNSTSSQTRLEVHPHSPQHSSSDFSTVTTGDDNNDTCKKADASENLPAVDENFWSEVFSEENSYVTSHFNSNINMNGDHMDFWYNLFTADGGLPELSEF